MSLFQSDYYSSFLFLFLFLFFYVAPTSHRFPPIVNYSILSSPLSCHALLYSTPLYSTLLYSTLLYSSIASNPILFYSILSYPILRTHHSDLFTDLIRISVTPAQGRDVAFCIDCENWIESGFYFRRRRWFACSSMLFIPLRLRMREGDKNEEEK